MPLSASVSTLEDLCSRQILSMLLFLSREDETKEWEPQENGADSVKKRKEDNGATREPPLDQRDLSANVLSRIAFIHGFLSASALEVLFEYCFSIYQFPVHNEQVSLRSSIGTLEHTMVHEYQSNDRDEDNDTNNNRRNNNYSVSNDEPSSTRKNIEELSGNDMNEDNRIPGDLPGALETNGKGPSHHRFVLERNIQCVDLEITWALLNMLLLPHQNQDDHLGKSSILKDCPSGLSLKSLEFRNDIHGFEYQYKVDQVHRVLALIVDSDSSSSLSRIRLPKLVPKPSDGEFSNPGILLIIRQLVSHTDQLRHLSLPDNRYCDNETLRVIGTQCHQLQFLDISGCSQVNDVGVQNLVFPNSVLRAGQVNLANNRIKTNPLSKYLRTVILWNTGVSETGCVILLRFLPRLLKPAGLLKHPEMANALVRIHDRIGFERGLQVDDLYDAGEVGNASRIRVFPHFISRTSRIHTSIMMGHRGKDGIEQQYLSPSMVCVQKHPRRLSHFYLDIGSSPDDDDEAKTEATIGIGTPTRLLLLMPWLDQIGNGLVVLHLPHQHENLPWEALCHACPHLIELEASLDVILDPTQWPSARTLSHLRVGKLTFDSPWGLAWTFWQLGTQLWDCDLTFRHNHNDLESNAGCWQLVEQHLFSSLKHPSIGSFSWNALALKSIKLGSQCHLGVAHLEMWMTSMPQLAFMGPLEHWNASIDVKEAQRILERALERNWNLSILLRNCVFSTQLYNPSNSLIENPWLLWEQSISNSPQIQRNHFEPVFEWGWKTEGTLELFKVEPLSPSLFPMNGDGVEPIALGNLDQPQPRLPEGHNPILNSNYPPKISPLDQVEKQTQTSTFGSPSTLNLGSIIPMVIEQETADKMVLPDEESEASSWDPMDECGFSSRSTSPTSIGEAPEGVVSVPTHISSNLAIDDIGSSIKPSLSYLLPVVPRNSETKENDDRERANPIKMKKIRRECPSESSESSSSEDEEGQEEEEDFQHFLIQKDPPMSVVEQWPDYEQSSYCPSKVERLMRAESTQPPEGHPFESANDDDNNNDDEEEDGDDDEDTIRDNTTDDEDDSDVEYDLEWYWDYQDKTWKRCDPSEWDLEESKETSHQTKPIDEKKGQKEGTQDINYPTNHLKSSFTPDEGVQTAFLKWRSLVSSSDLSANSQACAKKVVPKMVDSSPKLSQTMARLQDRMSFSSELSRCRTVKNIRQYELARLGQTKLVQKRTTKEDQ